MKIIEIVAKENTVFPNSKFIFECESISLNIKENEFTWNELNVIKDQNDFNFKGTAWNGKGLDNEDAFIQTINDYIRGNLKSFDLNFASEELMELKKACTETELYQIESYGLLKYVLAARSKDGTLYFVDQDGDKYMALDPEGDIATDMEGFFMSALCDDVEEDNLLYINKEMIDIDNFNF